MKGGEGCTGWDYGGLVQVVVGEDAFIHGQRVLEGMEEASGGIVEATLWLAQLAGAIVEVSYIGLAQGMSLELQI